MPKKCCEKAMNGKKIVICYTCGRKYVRNKDGTYDLQRNA